MIRCPVGHHFNGPIESLTPGTADNHDPGNAGASSRAGRDGLLYGHDGRDGDGGPALRGFPAASERKDRRPNTAPAYYLSHPAAVWIIAMRPRRRHTRPATHISAIPAR
jgi:hypothetical protein